MPASNSGCESERECAEETQNAASRRCFPLRTLLMACTLDNSSSVGNLLDPLVRIRVTQPAPSSRLPQSPGPPPRRRSTITATSQSAASVSCLPPLRAPQPSDTRCTMSRQSPHRPPLPSCARAASRRSVLFMRLTGRPCPGAASKRQRARRLPEVVVGGEMLGIACVRAPSLAAIPNLSNAARRCALDARPRAPYCRNTLLAL